MAVPPPSSRDRVARSSGTRSVTLTRSQVGVGAPPMYHSGLCCFLYFSVARSCPCRVALGPGGGTPQETPPSGPLVLRLRDERVRRTHRSERVGLLLGGER